MLEHRASQVHEGARALKTAGYHLGGDRAPSVLRLTRPDLRFSDQSAYKDSSCVVDSNDDHSLYCSTYLRLRPFVEHLEPASKKGTEIPLARSFPPCSVAKKRAGLMIFLEQTEDLNTVSSGIWYQHKKRKFLEEDVQEQKEEGQDKEELASHQHEPHLAPKLSQEFFGSDSELTVEHMADGSSRASSVDDGCALPLASPGTAAESLAKGSFTPDKTQVADISFAFSIQGNLYGQREQQSWTGARELQEKQFKLFSPLAAAQQERKATVHEGYGLDDIASASAATRKPSHVGTANQAVVEDDENWLQLGLGRSSPEPTRMHAPFYRSRSSEQVLSDHVQQENLATLQLMPQRSENEPGRSREIFSASRSEADLMSRSEDETGKLIHFMAPTTARQDSTELQNKYFTERSAYMESSRQNQEATQQFLPHHATTYSSLLTGGDLPVSNMRPLSFPSLKEDLQILATRNKETSYHADRGRLEVAELSRPRVGISNDQAEYHYVVKNQPTNIRCSQTGSEDRSQNIHCFQGPMLPAAPSWPDLVEQASRRMGRSAVDSSLCLVEPRVASQLNPFIFQTGSNVSEEWQGIVSRFNSNLQFQNSEADGSVLGSGRFSGNLLPPHDLTAFQRAIESFQASRSQSWEDKNTASLVPSWNNTTFCSSLLKSSASEIADRRMPSVGIAERASPAASRSPYETARSFLPPNQAHGFTRNLLQRSETQSMSDAMRLTKPSRQQPGIWLILQAAENQTDDRVLPQIPKTYLRIKDGNMTISIVQKYLVAKLGLSSETEVDIACRGQVVLPSLSLQHVRDAIWFSIDLERGEKLRFRSSNASSTSFLKDHIITLTYQRHS